MGHVHPDGQPRHMRRSRAPNSSETDQVFHQVERHLDRLTTVVPMTEIEDLLVAYQRQVTGVPRTWIRLFWRVAQVVLCYSEVQGEASGDAP